MARIALNRNNIMEIPMQNHQHWFRVGMMIGFTDKEQELLDAYEKEQNFSADSNGRYQVPSFLIEAVAELIAKKVRNGEAWLSGETYSYNPETMDAEYCLDV